MSLPSSLNPARQAEYLADLARRVTEVAEVSFFGFAEPCDQARFAELTGALADATSWLTVSIGFRGVQAGRVILHLPEQLVRDLLAAFLGLAPDDPVTEAEVRDSLGEFGNMVCGSWLTQVADRQPFDLDPPRVESQPQAWQPALADEPNAPPVLRMCLNDVPVTVELELQAAAA